MHAVAVRRDLRNLKAFKPYGFISQPTILNIEPGILGTTEETSEGYGGEEKGTQNGEEMIMYNDVNTMVPHTRLSHSQEGTKKTKTEDSTFVVAGTSK